MKHLRKTFKFISIFVIVNLLYEMIYPVVAFSLTGGPSQPEVQSFQPIDATDLVDPLTGSFSYSIPLIDIDGYPLNLSYDANVSMDDEASWVGLGWNLSPGVINRNMRGIPDDFKGDLIVSEQNIKNNVTVGINPGFGTEIFGSDKLALNVGLGINYNNYRGIGFERSFNISASVLDATKSPLEASLGFSNSSHDGISTNVSLKQKISTQRGDFSRSLGSAFNSRSGMQYLTIKDEFNMGGGISPSAQFMTNFALPTYTPIPEMSMKNESFSFSAKGGATIIGIDGTLNLQGHLTIQKLDKKKLITPAFGYLYNDDGIKLDKVILDFNREKDGSFNLNTPALPLTNHTYDTYTIAAQGIQGSFRPYRGGLTYVHDAYRETKSVGGSAGGEFAVIQSAKGGIDINVNKVINHTGIWEENNFLLQNFTLPDNLIQNIINPVYEPVYYKMTSESTPMPYNETFFDYMDVSNPLRPKVTEVGRFNTVLHSSIESKIPPFIESGSSIGPRYENIIISDKENYRISRDRRNTSISYITRKEVYSSGLDLPSYVYSAPDHHISEFTVTQPDGTRYVFGLPAYNTKKNETTFSVDSEDVDYETGMANYNPGEDNSNKNKKGLDHYFQNIETPPYAHSYLLTAILGPDYSDVDEDKGPSSGDFGHYIRFNYKRAINKYKWRVPFEENKANHHETFLTSQIDHRASYTYGEKEIWYISTIESRNYIAVFHTKPRLDGYEVADKNGSIGVLSMHLLDKISLYSQSDYSANGTNAIPIKEVHFEYDYSLCPDVHNNLGVELVVNGVNLNENKGKLTLKKVYFTYGNSNRGRYNAYEFYYREDVPDYNPSYDMKAYDRWGNYKPNVNPMLNHDEELPNAYFPYTPQDKELADKYSSVWLLSEIKLPSGGKIIIEYESNEYAYVQNRRAMQMFMVERANNSSVLPNLATKIPLRSAHDNPNNFLFFKLSENIPVSEYSVNDFRRDYIGEMDYLYFRFFSHILSGKREFVSGYAEIENSGLIESGGNYTHGWIKVKTAHVGNNDNIKVNPMQKAAIQYGRLNLPNLVYNQPDLNDLNEGDFAGYILHVAKALAASNILESFDELFKEPNRRLYENGIGQYANTDQSWIRLKSPEKRKLGGGARVKRVLISDEWGEMSQSGSTFQYGKEYDYTVTEPNTGRNISSGVATYEPMIGADENPFRQPVYFGSISEKGLIPNDENFLEEPFGESFFPSPSIGYSKVTVRDIKFENVNRRATGQTVYKFYTAKDFPTITRRTGLFTIPQKKEPVIKFLYYSSKDLMTASQGFVIELNDMHGKPKEVIHYDHSKNQRISKQEYIYKKEVYGDAFKVKSDVNVIYPNGDIKNVEMGIDMDVVLDVREFGSSSRSVGGQANLAGFFLLFPIVIPTGFPEISESESRFRSAVITKVISRKGILEEVRKHDLGATVVSRNKAYDAITGEVLLTQHNNNFEDPVYTFKIPAHWHYKNMGPAYENIGYREENVTIDSDGYVLVSDAPKKFKKGDEIVTGDGDGPFWVSEVHNNKIKLINYYGRKASEMLDITLIVIRSANKNMQKNIVGTIVSFHNPLEGFLENVYSEILEAHALVYTDEWRIPCDCFETSQQTFIHRTNNPFVIGLKGNWQNEREYLFLSDRILTHQNNNSNLRSDGLYSSFSAFWKLDDENWIIDEEGWVWTSTITEINPYSNAIESIDALERYSAQLYGYNNRLTTATVNNSQHQEAGFDSFEDYDFTNCFDDHMNLKIHKENVVDGISHTGRRSILVENENSELSVNYVLILCNPEP